MMMTSSSTFSRPGREFISPEHAESGKYDGFSTPPPCMLVRDRTAAREQFVEPWPGQAEYLDLLRAVLHLKPDTVGEPSGDSSIPWPSSPSGSMRNPEPNVPIGRKTSWSAASTWCGHSLPAEWSFRKPSPISWVSSARRTVSRPPKIDTLPGQPPEPQPEPVGDSRLGPDVPFWHARDFKAHEPLHPAMSEILPSSRRRRRSEPVQLAVRSRSPRALTILTRLRRLLRVLGPQRWSSISIGPWPA